MTLELQTIESVPHSEVSYPPQFDVQKGLACRSKAFTLIESFDLNPDSFQALGLAITLMFYNNRSENENAAILRAERLVAKELVAQERHEEYTLPTIGIEIEVPRKPFSQTPEIYHQYAGFFDGIGMPRNRINTGHLNEKIYKHDFVWEFSTPPSYSSDVQNRIIAELIHGRFIPSVNKQDPEKARELLDTQMVSLHVNLGIPEHINRGMILVGDRFTLAGAFALAYSSKQRIEGMEIENLSNVKDENVEQLSPFSRNIYRLEIKGLEVFDSSVYEAITNLQLLGIAFFANAEADVNELSTVWKSFKKQTVDILQEYVINVPEGFIPDFLEHRQNLSHISGNPSLVKKLKTMLRQESSNVKKLAFINSSKRRSLVAV